MSAVAAAKLAQARALRAQADGLEAEAAALDAGTPATAGADRLVPFPFALEARAARALIQRGELRAVRIGRRLFARSSDVVALVDKLEPVAPRPAAPANDAGSYAAVIASVGGGRR